jgi:iron complex outermembrane receptor protein
MNTQRVHRHTGLTLLTSALLLAIPLLSPADELAGPETEKLMELSLEELLQVKVTTLSRKPQPLSTTPAAIFVISQNDIQRSGALSIPEVLRMAPGIEVARVDANTWAVTARGSNGVFANKLLVLMDGRTLYSPMYSGVYWEIQDTDLASIERIEVVRGPGATMWGANAVNGVINIITKDAKDTQGTSAEAVAGNYTNFETTVRHGGEAGNMNYRAFVKYFDRDGFAEDSYDDWQFSRIGGRLDWSDQSNDELTFTGELYSGTVGENNLTNQPSPPYATVGNFERDFTGGFANGVWNHSLSEESDLQVRLSFDRNAIDNLAPEESRNTWDLDFQHHKEIGSRHDLVWGLGYLNSKDDTQGSFTVGLDPQSRTLRRQSGFIQDEIRMSDTVNLTLGTKVEKNSFDSDNFEWSPNIRLAWQANESSTVWGSVARAIRSPSRIEQDGHIVGIMLPPFVPVGPGQPSYPLPTAITINGNPDLGSEKVVAYEAGFRSQPFETMSYDIAIFYNEYNDLRDAQFQTPICEPSGVPVTTPPDPLCFAAQDPYINLPMTFFNAHDQDNYGLELAISHKALDWWRLDWAYSYLHAGDPVVLPFSVGQDSPEHQLSLRSAMDVSQTVSLDLWLRYVDELKAQGVDDYTTMDARVSFLPIPSLRLTIEGRNLLEAGHTEFIEEFGVNRGTEIPREGYVQLQWQF